MLIERELSALIQIVDMSFEVISTIIIQYALFGLANEALSELIVDSEFSASLFRNRWRKWTYPANVPPPDTTAQRIRVFIDKLWSCGYCTSVWTSAFFAFFVPLDGPRALTYVPGVSWLLAALIIHRFSNWFHVVFELFKRGRVRTYDFAIKIVEDVNDD